MLLFAQDGDAVVVDQEFCEKMSSLAEPPSGALCEYAKSTQDRQVPGVICIRWPTGAPTPLSGYSMGTLGW